MSPPPHPHILFLKILCSLQMGPGISFFSGPKVTLMTNDLLADVRSIMTPPFLIKQRFKKYRFKSGIYLYFDKKDASVFKTGWSLKCYNAFPSLTHLYFCIEGIQTFSLSLVFKNKFAKMREGFQPVDHDFKITPTVPLSI